MSGIMNLFIPRTTNTNANIVALHCSMGSARQWSGLLGACGDAFNAVALDLQGYGDNPPSSQPAPSFLEAEARHLHGDLDRLAGPIHLVGHSFGGAIAFTLATTPRYARRIRSLTLIEPVLPAVLLDEAIDAPLYDLFAQESARICTPLWAGDRRLGLQRFLRFWNGPGCYEGLSDDRRESLLARVNKLAADFSAIFGATGVTTAARQLAVPTLLFSGGTSPAPTQQIVARLTSCIPGARRVHLPDAGHMLAITHAAEINPQIMQHVTSSRPVPGVVVPLAPAMRERTPASRRAAGHSMPGRPGF